MAKNEVLGSKAITSATIFFHENFQHELIGEIKADSAVSVSFDSNRLPFERSVDVKGKPGWTISAFYQFAPNTEVHQVKLASEKATTRKKATPEDEFPIIKGDLKVPPGSEELVIWFLNTGFSEAKFYDSNLGTNYRFPIAATVLELVNEEIVPVSPEAPAATKKSRAKKT